MRVVGIENMICDYYFWNNQVFVNGGGTVSNILVNLDHQKIPCKLIGYCGADEQGTWIRNSLKQTTIDIQDITITNHPTKNFYIKDGKTTSYCPICQTKKERYPNFSLEKITSSITPTDYLLLKDYSITNVKLIIQLSNPILLDISTIKHFIYMEKEKIENYIFYPYKIMNISEDTFEFLLKKLNQTKKELLHKMNSELIIITKGKKGTEFFYHDHHYDFSIENPFPEIETNGCGDTFFSNIICHILLNPKKIWTETDFQKMFFESQKKVEIVLKNIGARNHIIPNVLIKKTNKCICMTFQIEEKID